MASLLKDCFDKHVFLFVASTVANESNRHFLTEGAVGDFLLNGNSERCPSPLTFAFLSFIALISSILGRQSGSGLVVSWYTRRSTPADSSAFRVKLGRGIRRLTQPRAGRNS